VDTVETTSLGPGLVAFLIVVFLGIATVALWYSMVKQIRKVPPTFDDPDTTDDDSQAEAKGDVQEPPASVS
jgi:hypothetical protein